MVQFEAPQNPPSHNLGRLDEQLRRPAFVHQLRLDDESFSPALRGVESRDWIREHLRSEARRLLDQHRSGPGECMQRPLTADLLSITELSPLERGELLGYRAHGDLAASWALLADVAYRGEPLDGKARAQLLASASGFVPRLYAQMFSLAGGAPDGVQLAEISVDGMLRSLIANVPDAELRRYYEDPGRSSRELVGVLQHLLPEDRVKFFLDLLSLQNPAPVIQKFLIEKLDNAIRIASVDERIEIIHRVLGGSSSPELCDRIAGILTASDSREQLARIVHGVGLEALLATGDPDVRECVAQVVLYEGLKEVRSQVSGDSPSDERMYCGGDMVTQSLLDGAVEALQSMAHLSDTDAYQTVMHIIVYNKAYYEAHLSPLDLSGEFSESFQAFKQKLKLELRYGILLTHSDSDAERGIAGRSWKLAELQQVERGLAALTEGAVIFTPWLFEVQRVESLGEGVMGARFADGTIRIADLAVDNVLVQLAYGGTPSLINTLVHEIGHGMQLGKGKGGIEVTGDTEFHFAAGEASADFDEFLRLAGWEVLHPERVEVGRLGLSVKLDGTEYPVGVPIRHQGREILLMVVGRDLVLAHDAFGDFTLVPYSRTSPWEDFAEAFAEYHLQPERLIRFAPEKFTFFEEEYRRYTGRRDLHDLLRQSLAGREGAS